MAKSNAPKPQAQTTNGASKYPTPGVPVSYRPVALKSFFEQIDSLGQIFRYDPPKENHHPLDDLDSNGEGDSSSNDDEADEVDEEEDDEDDEDEEEDSDDEESNDGGEDDDEDEDEDDDDEPFPPRVMVMKELTDGGFSNRDGRLLIDSFYGNNRPESTAKARAPSRGKDKKNRKQQVTPDQGRRPTPQWHALNSLQSTARAAGSLPSTSKTRPSGRSSNSLAAPLDSSRSNSSGLKRTAAQAFSGASKNAISPRASTSLLAPTYNDRDETSSSGSSAENESENEPSKGTKNLTKSERLIRKFLGQNSQKSGQLSHHSRSSDSSGKTSPSDSASKSSRSSVSQQSPKIQAFGEHTGGPSRASQNADSEEESTYSEEEAEAPTSGRLRGESSLRLDRSKKRPGASSSENTNQSSRRTASLSSSEANDSKQLSEIPRSFSKAKKRGDRGQRFTPEEIETLTAYRAQYCDENDISETQFNELVQSNARGHSLNGFWDDIWSVVPRRGRAAVKKSTRRLFHNFIRGSWTKYDDDQLAKCYAEYGPRWSRIAEEMDRMAEDVRDRWRNYVVSRDTKKNWIWKYLELKALKRAVGLCALRVWEADGRPQEISDEDYESRINWGAVSQTMGGVRSRGQCRWKWKKLIDVDDMSIQNELSRAIKRSRKARENEEEEEEEDEDEDDSSDDELPDIFPKRQRLATSR